MTFEHLEHHLFLLMLNLSQMSGQDLIINIFTDSINSLSDKYQIRFSSEPCSVDREVLNVTTMQNDFGCIELIPVDGFVIDNTTKSLLRNSVGMLALFLEKQVNDHLLADEKLLLEATVSERTRALEHSNRELQQEIQERAKIEQELKESKHFIQQILETTPNLLYIYNLVERRNEYANREIFEMLGYNQEEIKAYGSNLMAHIFHPEEIAFVVAHHETLRNSETDKVHELVFRTKHIDGDWRWLRSKDVPFARSADGKVVTILGIAEDITDRINAQENKEKFEEQLRQAQKMESVGQLAGGVAHDFNNMLGVILGYTELALEQLDPALPLFHHLEEVRRAAARSADITRQLLAFARKQTVSPKVLDLNETVEGMLKMLRRLIGEDIDLTWQPGTALWPIKMDPSQIDQILANLCVNARDAISGVGRLTVETANSTFNAEYCSDHAGFVPGEYVRIAVSDNGRGMDQETLAHIFEPFFTTKGIGEGTGLGLATVYGAVRQNNGFINVYCEPGQGTIFTIYLPRYQGIDGRPGREDAIKPDRGGHESILLVEDEQTIRNMTATMLERLGYTVMVSDSPGAAILLVEKFAGQIDLLLTDVIMPEMNGWNLAKRLLVKQPTMKCLFMSGYTANIIANQGILEEEVHFIQKPFSKKELAAKVREALEMGR